VIYHTFRRSQWVLKGFDGNQQETRISFGIVILWSIPAVLTEKRRRTRSACINQ
jgi:hypothetical protein